MLTSNIYILDGEEWLQADQRLASVSADLTAELIQEVVLDACDLYVNSLSGYQQPNGKNKVLQAHVTDLLHGRLCAIGWEKSNLNQVSCAINKRHGVRLCRSTNGGAAIGRKEFNPVLRTKGRGTLQIAGCDASVTLPIPGLE